VLFQYLTPATEQKTARSGHFFARTSGFETVKCSKIRTLQGGHLLKCLQTAIINNGMNIARGAVLPEDWGIDNNLERRVKNMTQPKTCREVTFSGTKTEVIYSQAKAFGIDGGEKWPIGARQVTFLKEEEFCQDIYGDDALDASAKLQETINGYARSNGYSVVSQKYKEFDPCDRSLFGDVLLWIGSLFGSDALNISNRHC